MLIVDYRHPLHGKQEIKCKELVNKGDGVLHAKNIHGVTFQTLEPDRIMSVNVQCENDERIMKG